MAIEMGKLKLLIGTERKEVTLRKARNRPGVLVCATEMHLFLPFGGIGLSSRTEEINYLLLRICSVVILYLFVSQKKKNSQVSFVVILVHFFCLL